MFKGFVLGILVALASVGGFVLWQQHQAAQRAATAPAGPPDAGTAAASRPRRTRRSARAMRAGEPAQAAAPAAPAPLKLSPADLRVVGAGDDLSKPDVLTLDMADQGSHELTQDDIDARFMPRQGAVIECVNRSQPDDETYVPGKVTVKFRIQRAGTVRGVRVEAPAILQRHGLLECVRHTLDGLRFAPSTGSQVVSYDFSLN